MGGELESGTSPEHVVEPKDGYRDVVGDLIVETKLINAGAPPDGKNEEWYWELRIQPSGSWEYYMGEKSDREDIVEVTIGDPYDTSQERAREVHSETVRLIRDEKLQGRELEGKIREFIKEGQPE